MPGIELLLAILPQVLSASARIGQGIISLLDDHADELTDDQRRRLDEVKARQAAEEARWAADLGAKEEAAEATARRQAGE